MQLKKKACTAAITAFLMLSLVLAVVPFATALSIPTLADSDGDSTGPVGEEVKVSGAGATPGGELKIYWDEVHDWDPTTGTGYLKSTYAKPDGTFSVNITIPEATAGDHGVVVKDVEAATIEWASYTVEAAIELTPAKGLPGDTITVEGTGFGESTNIALMFWNTTTLNTEPATEVIATGDGSTTSFAGTLVNRYIVPGSITITANVTLPATLTITDQGNGTLYGEDLTDPNCNATGTINYVTGAWSLTFTHAPNATSGGGEEKITADYTYYKASTTSRVLYFVHPSGLKSNVIGSFTTTFKVPSVSDGSYNVTALDGIGNIAHAAFTVSHLYITLEPTEGIAGTEVTVKGRGFTASSTVDIYFGTLVYPSGFYTKVKSYVPTDSNGDFETTFTVPSCEPAGYYVTAIDAEGVKESATFAVKAVAEITVEPKSGLPGSTVTIEGNHFTEGSTVTIYFDETVLLADVGTNTTGGFSVDVTIPEDAAIGSYTIKAVDTEGISATTTFKVTEKLTIIEPRSDTYYRGDQISFYVNSTLSFTDNEIEVTVTDPYGVSFAECTFIAEDIDGIWVVPYYNSTLPPLPSDAVLGTWNWTATYTLTGETETEISGSFTVLERPTLAGILDRLNELDVKLSGLITDSEGNVKAYIDTSLGPVISAEIVDVKDGVATLSTDVGDVKTSLSNIGAKITSLDGDVATISTAVGDIKTSVDSIGLKVDSISGDVATLKTDLGTISGKVTSIDGNVATIKTDVGTVKMDVSDVKGYFPVTVDVMPIYAAVVLSLIAAVAAIAAVVQISRKIAG